MNRDQYKQKLAREDMMLHAESFEQKKTVLSFAESDSEMIKLARMSGDEQLEMYADSVLANLK